MLVSELPPASDVPQPDITAPPKKKGKIRSVLGSSTVNAKAERGVSKKDE